MKPGTVVWVTGPPSAGKSLFARRLKARLEELGAPCALLDGDEVRDALVPRPGYGPRARSAFYGTLAGLAALLARQGLQVLVAATANRRAYRERARAIAPSFVEVFADVPPEVCARRDPKGLYRLARRGGAPNLPGAGAPYERPEAPEVTARGGLDERALRAVLARLTPGASRAPRPRAPRRI